MEKKPTTVELINKQENRTDIYHYLNETYLAKCLRFIEDNENEKCKECYIQMMEDLFEEKKKWI